MCFRKYLMLIAVLGINVYSSEFQDFLSRVNSINNPTDKQAVVDSFMIHADSVGVPFVEGNTANFLYKGNVSSVQVAGDFNGWSSSAMSRLSGTDLFYLIRNFELDARFDYKLVVNGQMILDPRNPNTVPGGISKNSELAMPDYVQPWEIVYNPNVERGKLTNFSLSSQIMNRNYSVTIYFPVGYDSAKSGGYSTAYYQDGSDYLSLGYGWVILDNLISQNIIEPILGVFVRPTNRNDEYAYDNRFKYAEFFANELVPHIDSMFNTTKSPQNRLVIGDSFGGNISALTSYQYPEVFGLCGLHSAAFWPNDYEVYNMIVSGETKDIKYYSVWGSYESLFTNMRNFQSEMTSLGYEIDGKEFHEGHSWGLWRATTDLILEYFFPSNTTNVVIDELVNEFVLYQNYPNPFNPSTTIKFSIPHSEFTTLKVYDLLGREVDTLLDEYLVPGTYQMEFDGSKLTSGIYFYTLYLNGNIQTKKMTLIK